MVKISRGDHEIVATMGAYENIFKPLGYTLVKAKKEEVEVIEEKKPEMPKKGKNKKQED